MHVFAESLKINGIFFFILKRIQVEEEETMERKGVVGTAAANYLRDTKLNRLIGKLIRQGKSNKRCFLFAKRKRMQKNSFRAIFYSLAPNNKNASGFRVFRRLYIFPPFE